MKRTHRETMKAILKALSDRKEHSYGDLERKVNTNWKTIRDHCDILEIFGAVTLTKEKKIKITEGGLKIRLLI